MFCPPFVSVQSPMFFHSLAIGKEKAIGKARWIKLLLIASLVAV